MDPTSGAGGSAQGPSTFLSTGAATYSVPIEVPKGRGGISPNLSLIYNSYQGNGWVGVGWMLDMGAIQRSTTNGLNYNANNFVATVNGSVSTLVPNTNWGANHYESQIEGAFLNYYFNSSTGGWQVTDKNGTVYSYGSSPASQQWNVSVGTFKWLLDQVQDVNGNYMTVSYFQDQGQVYLQEIDYTGNVNGLPWTNQVIFDRVARSDAQTSFATHAPVTTAYLLQEIRVYGNGQQGNGQQLARRYNLNYAYSPSTSRAILQSVTQYGSDGKSTLPPVTFQWQSETAGFTHVAGGASGFQSPVNYKVVDLNGDGSADIIYENNNGDRTSNFGVLFSARTANAFDTNITGSGRYAAYHPHSMSFQLADLNGDGLPDLVYIDKNYNIHVLTNTTATTGTTGPPFSADSPSAIVRTGVDPYTGFQLADVKLNSNH